MKIIGYDKGEVVVMTPIWVSYIESALFLWSMFQAALDHLGSWMGEVSTKHARGGKVKKHRKWHCVPRGGVR